MRPPEPGERIVEPRIVKTAAGVVRVTPAGPEVHAALAAWPKPIREVPTREGPLWAIGFSVDGVALEGVRAHYGFHRDPEEAAKQGSLQRAVLAPAVAELARAGFRGVILPAVFVSESRQPPFMSGHALFGRSAGPHAGGLGCAPLADYERVLGPGGTNLALSFLKYAERAWNAAGIPPRTLADLDIVPRESCGALALDLMLAGEHVVCLHRTIDEAHPVWEQLAAAGVERVAHLPALPATV